MPPGLPPGPASRPKACLQACLGASRLEACLGAWVGGGCFFFAEQDNFKPQALCLPTASGKKPTHSISTTIFSVLFQNWLQRVVQHQLRPKILCCCSLEGTSQIVLCWKKSNNCGVRTHALTDWHLKPVP